MDSSPSTKSPLPKRNKSSKTVEISDKTPIRTPRQMTVRGSTRLSRLQK